jgi:zinc protease
VMTGNIYKRETADGMVGSAAENEAFTGDPDFSDRYADGVRAVRNEDVLRVARKYFTDARLSVVILKPQGESTASGRQDQVKPGDIERVVLPNGLILLLKEDHSLPIVSFNAAFNGGMRQETLQLNGLSSLVGSVWTKGLPGESSDQVRAKLEARGAGLSAYSGHNSFVFSMSYLAEDQAMMLDYLEKFMTAPAFPVDEIARDKEQMLTALMTRKDSVMQTAARALVETLFEKHPFRLDSLGTEESLKRIKQKDLVDVFRNYIRSDNGVVAVFGDIDKKKMREELERRLGKLRKGKPSLALFSEDAPAVMRLKELMLDKGQAAVLFGFRGPTISDKDRYASEVLVNVLSSSLGGRLFRRVREELGKSYAVSGGMSPAVDAGMMSFYALTSNDGVDKVRSIMEEEFVKVRQDLISEKELADAKAYLIGDMARDMQTLAAQSITRAVDELLGLGYRNVDDYSARINAVNLEDVRAAAKKYLDLRHAAVVLSRAARAENSAE